MKLHRLVVEDFRGITAASVEVDEVGVTIVSGDNEVGKSSLAEALQMVLHVMDSSTSQLVKAAQPVGRDVAPRVTVEMTTGPYRFTLRKQWLRRPATELEVVAPRPEQLSGRTAHERVQAMLNETLDADLWRALRFEQGNDLTLPRFLTTTLGQALDTAAGAVAAEGDHDALWQRIVDTYEEYWTPTGRPRGDRVQLQDRLAAVQVELADAEARVADVDRAVGEIERLQREEVALVHSLTDLERSARDHRARVAEVRQARAVRDDLARAVETHRSAAALQQNLADQRASLVARLAAAQQRLAQAEAEQGATPDDLEALERRCAAANEALHSAREARRAAEQRAAQATADVEHLRRVAAIEHLDQRIERAERAEADLAAAAEALAEARVDDDALAGIEAASVAVVRAQAGLDVHAATVEVEALDEVEVDLDGVVVPLAAQQRHQAQVGGDLSLTVPGVIRVRWRSGGAAQDLAAGLRAAQADLDARCAAAGVADVGQARAAHQARARALAAEQRAREQLAEQLHGETLITLRAQRAGLASQVEAYLAGLEGRPGMPADVDDAVAVQRVAQADLVALTEALEGLEADATGAAQQLADAAVARAGADAAMASAHSAVAVEQAALDAARQAISDEVLDDALAAALAAKAEGEAALAEADRTFASLDPALIEDLAANAEEALERATTALSANRLDQQRHHGQLEALGEAGAARAVDEARTRVTRLTRQVAADQARAEAARLLFTTFDRHRQAAHARYHEPFRQQLVRLGSVVYGPTFDVELDDDLCIERRSLDGATVAFKQLSTGAREQLALLSRLACAMLVAGDDGAPVLIDDALGWSDPTRLVGMNAAIALAGRTCQILLLTCAPDRFAAVGNARVVQLRAS